LTAGSHGQRVPQLISLDECEQLTAKRVHDLYRKYVSRSQVSLMTSFGFGRELVESAEGAWITTRDGRRILDFTGGVGVLNHGHNHPRILAARKRFQDARRMEVHKTYFSPYVAALGHNLAQLLPDDLNMSFLPNSGAEAVEGAVKLAYKYHGGKRHRIIRADIAFHGKLLGSGGLTGTPDRFRFPEIPGVVSVPTATWPRSATPSATVATCTRSSSSRSARPPCGAAQRSSCAACGNCVTPTTSC